MMFYVCKLIVSLLVSCSVKSLEKVVSGVKVGHVLKAMISSSCNLSESSNSDGASGTGKCVGSIG